MGETLTVTISEAATAAARFLGYTELKPEQMRVVTSVVMGHDDLHREKLRPYCKHILSATTTTHTPPVQSTSLFTTCLTQNNLRGARGGHSYSTRRTVRDRGQDAVKRSSRIFSTGQAVKRTFWVGQRSRPTFAQTNSYSNSYPTGSFCLHCLSQQVDLTVTGACARPNWADFSPVLEPDTVINPRRACAARVTVVVPCVCVCVCVFPRPSSATRATKRQTRHTGDLSIVFASV